MRTPEPFQPTKIREGRLEVTVRDLHALITGLNLDLWGDAVVYVGNDGKCPMVEFSQCSGVPASNGAFGKNPAVPKSIQIQFMTPDQVQEYEKMKNERKPK